MGLDTFRALRPKSVRKQIADHVREQILSGDLAVGEKLASTQELSRIWGIPTSTVQAALRALGREGLLVRTPRLGTFVAEPKRTLTRVAIYLARDAWAEKGRTFTRALCSAASASAAATSATSRGGCCRGRR